MSGHSNTGFWHRAARLATLTVALAAVAGAVYAMVRRLGLNDSMDFGAGAYYYADIPEFDKVLDAGNYESTLSLPLAIVLFLAWGALMYALWKRVDRSSEKQ